MPRWYDRELDSLERDLMDGVISNAEYNKQLRELNAEVRDAAEEEAARAYDDYMGNMR